MLQGNNAEAPMKHVVFVDGQEGTTGLRIHEVLGQRDDIELLSIASDRRKDVPERTRLLNAADVAFLCLPDDAAREAAALVTNPHTCLIDASTAHRTAPDWVFGMPELAPDQRERLRASKRIANPGCHASAFILLLRPLVDAGLVPASLPLSATSITGYSGGGKKMIEQYERGGDAALVAPRPYASTKACAPLTTPVEHHAGLAVAGRLGQAHVARDHGVEDLVAEVRLELLADLLLQVMRGSNMTRSRPMTCSSRLRLACTCLMVLTRSDRPSSAKYSHCMGTITPWALHRPLRVSRLSDGGQSISTKS
jgi:hypothetical protein